MGNDVPFFEEGPVYDEIDIKEPKTKEKPVSDSRGYLPIERVPINGEEFF